MQDQLLNIYQENYRLEINYTSKEIQAVVINDKIEVRKKKRILLELSDFISAAVGENNIIENTLDNNNVLLKLIFKSSDVAGSLIQLLREEKEKLNAFNEDYSLEIKENPHYLIKHSILSPGQKKKVKDDLILNSSIEKLKPNKSSFFKPLEPPIFKSNLLCGQLPGNHEKLYFSEEMVLADGNCGFTTLGTNRQELAETLLTFDKDNEARELLKEEIREALMTELIISIEGTRLLQALYEQQGLANEELSRIRKTIPSLPHFEHDTLSSTINWLNTNGAPEEAETLSQMELQTFHAEDAILIYCKSPEAFRIYCHKLKSDNGLWLGYQSALLYAKAKGITLYIWVKSENYKNSLILQKYNIGDSGQVIHMLSTGGFTHFNLLVEEVDECITKTLITHAANWY